MEKYFYVPLKLNAMDARLTTQVKVVKDHYEEINRRTCTMFMFQSAIFDGKGENFQPTQKQKQEIFDRWYLLDYLDKYTEVLRKEWERLEIEETFPERERDDQEECYEYARDVLKKRMSKCGIDSVHYKPSLMLPELEGNDRERGEKVKRDKMREMEIEDAIEISAEKVQLVKPLIDFGLQTTTNIRDSFGCAMGVDKGLNLDGIALEQAEETGSRNLGNLETAVLKEFDVFANPIPLTSANANRAQAQSTKNNKLATRRTCDALPHRFGVRGNFGSNKNGNGNGAGIGDSGGRNSNFSGDKGGSSDNYWGGRPSSSGNGSVEIGRSGGNYGRGVGISRSGGNYGCGGGIGLGSGSYGRGNGICRSGGNYGSDGGNFQGESNLGYEIHSNDGIQVKHQRPIFAFDHMAWRKVLPFTGQYLDFDRFIKSFIRLVDFTDRADEVKLELMMTKLDDATIEMIENCHCDSYEEILEMLFKEYTDETRIISHIFQQANEAPLVYSLTDIEGMCFISERLDSVIRLLNHYGLDESYEKELFEIFVSKVPKAVSSLYLNRIQKEKVSLQAFLHFLRDRENGCRELEMLELMRENARASYQLSPNGSGGKSSIKSGGRYFTGKSGHVSHETEKGLVSIVQGKTRQDSNGQGDGQQGKQVATGNRADRRELAKPCFECGHPAHSSLYCKSVTPAEKRDIVVRHSLCYRCLKSGHVARNCEVKDGCSKCGRYHHHLLCLKPDGGRNYERGKQEIESRMNFMTGRDGSGQIDQKLLARCNNGPDYDGALGKMGEEAHCAPSAFSINGYSLTGVLETGATVGMVSKRLKGKLGSQPDKVVPILSTTVRLFNIDEVVNVKDRIGRLRIPMSIETFGYFGQIIDYFNQVFQHDFGARTIGQLYGQRIDLAMLKRDENGQMGVLVKLVKANDIVFMKPGGQMTRQIVTLCPYQCTEKGQVDFDEKNIVSLLNSNKMAIEKTAVSTTVKSPNSFLGKIYYYHKFIPNRAVLLYPLYKSLRGNVVWQWSRECQQAIEKVNNLLTFSPVLEQADTETNTILCTDVSRKGLGAFILMMATICCCYYFYHQFIVASQFAKKGDGMIEWRRIMRIER